MKPLTIATVVLLFSHQPGMASAFSHRAFDQILKKHVRHGKVDYVGIRQHSKAQLAAYLDRVARARVSGKDPDALAFYLNAYNALVIDGVVQRLPEITSVEKVSGFFDRVKHTVAGRRLTLNELENKIIRPRFGDPRIHFALVCAARSCPPLRAAAFEGASLNRVLDKLTRAFINSPGAVRVKGEAIEISQLFKWYAQDFVKAAGSIGKYLAKYHRTHAKRLGQQKQFGYLHYSWTLNKK